MTAMAAAMEAAGYPPPTPASIAPRSILRAPDRDTDPQTRSAYWNTTCPDCPTVIPKHRTGCHLHGVMT